jgi:phosphopantothenoylcysteine decarboxylase/phosphopantothenate--cysteine ligase
MARILITAGPTRAAIDDVRFLTNASSGRMALALVKAARAAGHDVIVVSGPVAIDYPAGVEVVRVTATSEMLAACLDRLPRVDGVIAAAAPCDFEPIKRVAGKIPRRGTTLVLRLRPTVDVIATVARKAKGSQWMVAFALEPGADPRRALEKITTKRCDLIVVNDLSAVDAAKTAVTVYDRSHARVGDTSGTKTAVSRWLIRLIEKRLM